MSRLIDQLTGMFGTMGHVASSVLRRAPARAVTIELRIPDLAAPFDGYGIVALSDFHQRPAGDLAWLAHAVEVALAERPDLIVLLGDYGSSFRRAPNASARWYQAALPPMTPLLRRLHAEDGVFAVLGNHDYYAGNQFVRAWIAEIGARTLVNEARLVHRVGGTLRVAGLDDLTQGKVDPRAGCELGEQPPTVLLSHNPDAVLDLDAALRADVMLAGHTHGGQIVLPGIGAPITMSRTCGRRSAHGWISNARAPLFVTRGLGEQLPIPIRVGSPPELLVLRLRAGLQQPP